MGSILMFAIGTFVENFVMGLFIGVLSFILLKFVSAKKLFNIVNFFQNSYIAFVVFFVSLFAYFIFSIPIFYIPLFVNISVFGIFYGLLGIILSAIYAYNKNEKIRKFLVLYSLILTCFIVIIYLFTAFFSDLVNRPFEFSLDNPILLLVFGLGGIYYQYKSLKNKDVFDLFFWNSNLLEKEEKKQPVKEQLSNQKITPNPKPKNNNKTFLIILLLGILPIFFFAGAEVLKTEKIDNTNKDIDSTDILENEFKLDDYYQGEKIRQQDPFSKTLRIYDFYGQSCPHCARANTFLTRLEREMDGVEVLKYEVENNPRNRIKFEQVAEHLNTEAGGVPFIIVGNKIFNGFGTEETTGREIRERVEYCLINQCPDTVDELVNLK